MGNGLQGPMAGAGQIGTEAASRESNLKAVQEDLFMTQELIDTLDATIRRLQEHLMGSQPMIEKAQLDTGQDEAPPSGTIPLLCNAGSTNIHKLRRLQERVNQICYELGADK